MIAIDVLDVGGMDEFVGFLARGLSRSRFDVHVAYRSPVQAGSQNGGGGVVRALASAGIPTTELRKADVEAWLAARRPDVISAHGAPDWLLPAAGRWGIPWVETLHGMHHLMDNRAVAAEVKRAPKVATYIAVSELVRRQYLRCNPTFAPGRIVTVANGVDTSRIPMISPTTARSALGITDEFLFVSLSRYGLQKNVYGLVSAFAEVAAAHPQAHLLVAGRADDAGYYQQVDLLARSLSCADRVHLRGNCPNPAALLAAADAFVLDSFFEGWSLASMEALAVGTAVIMSDVGGAREQLAEARGYLVPNPAGNPEDVDWERISRLRFVRQPNRAELVAAMSNAVRARTTWAGRRAELAESARVAFSPDRCLAGHAEVLRTVVRDERNAGVAARRAAGARGAYA